ncbi:hypothetical protein [Amycolatopsis sp. lyj-84]|uniref:hypothetical protein n=1 Tax=Amycolatopsis sp. lyj-84 TaxID=2789284 RepID=UPI00397DB5B2
MRIRSWCKPAETTTPDETEPSGKLDHLTTAQAAVAVIQAISALNVAHDDPDLPAEIFP